MARANRSKKPTSATFLRVRDVISDSMDVDSKHVVPTTILSSDLGAQSIDYLDIRLRLEEEFGTQIPQDEPLLRLVPGVEQQPITVQMIVDYFEARLKK